MSREQSPSFNDDDIPPASPHTPAGPAVSPPATSTFPPPVYPVPQPAVVPQRKSSIGCVWVTAVFAVVAMIIGLAAAFSYGSSLSPVYTPQSTTPTNVGCPGGIVKIVSVVTGKALDIPSASPDDHVSLQQFHDNGGENQQWQFVPMGDSWFKIVSVATGKVLDVPSGSLDDHVIIQQFSDNGGGMNQQWQCVPVGSRYFEIRSRSSGKVLDVPSASPDDHVLI